MLMLIVGLPSLGHAIGGIGIGIRGGLVVSYDHPVLDDQGIKPEDLSMFGGHVTIISISKISVEASGEYSYRDYDRTIDIDVVGERTFGFTVKDYAGYATGRLKLISGTWGVHFGAGLNVHRYVYKMDLPFDLGEGMTSTIELPEDDWHTGFHVLAGVSFGPPMTPIRVFGEARVAKVGFDDDSVTQTTLLAGVTLGLF
jgi:hypothetical protein